MATMQLKTYRAATMADALAEVKKDLGRDAVILHTRTYRTGGVMGVGARAIVEITASSGGASPAPRAGRETTPASATSTSVRETPKPDPLGFVEFRPPNLELPRRAVDQRSAQEVSSPERLTSERARPAFPASDRRAGEQPGRPNARPIAEPADPAPRASPSRPSLATPVRLSPQDAGARAALEDELASIKALVGEVLRVTRVAQRRAAVDDAPPDSSILGGAASPAPSARNAGHPSDATSYPRVLMRSYLRLIDAGIEEPIAESIASTVRDELSSAELADQAIVTASILREVERRLPIARSGVPGTPSAAGPRVIALIGPTGVGKTTTLAKLAATFKLRHARSVGLITCDTYRIAAVEQLRTYAGIIGLPLRVAMTPGEMRDSMLAMSDRDIVLIDTPGRSPGDAARLSELHAFMEASGATEVHLALSAAAAPAALARAIDRFRGLGAHAVILTKLDEAGTSGPIVNIAARAGLPLSYVTMGQEVPDDIEPADAARLARRVLESDFPRESIHAGAGTIASPGPSSSAVLSGAGAW